MLIQLKATKHFLTLSFRWTENPFDPSLACTTPASLSAVCKKIGLNPSDIELIPFAEAYKTKTQ